MKTKLTLLILLLLVSFSCKKEVIDTIKTYSLTGNVQKGPFIIGTNITIKELDNNINQTGKSFSTTVKSDDGFFEINNVNLESDKVMLIADGFYFNEVLGEISSEKLTLYSICDLSDNSNVNINVLTHIEKARVENLVLSGLSFLEAKAIARNELYSFFGADNTISINTELLDISKDNDQDAILLAASVILQRYSFNNALLPTVAEFTQLLSNFSNDFQDNGQIDDQSIIDTILHNISYIKFNEVENNILSRYNDLEKEVELPDFKKYIIEFQEKYSPTLHTDFFYPDRASIAPYLEDCPELINLFNYSDTEFNAGVNYSIAAIIPLDASLTIKFITNKTCNVFPELVGWDFINNSNGFTLTAQSQNNLMTTEISLSDTSGTATIEFYENNSSIPTRIKNIEWE